MKTAVMALKAGSGIGVAGLNIVAHVWLALSVISWLLFPVGALCLLCTGVETREIMFMCGTWIIAGIMAVATGTVRIRKCETR